MEDRGLSELGNDPNAIDPDYVVRLTGQMRLLFGPRGWFRVDCDGWESLPPAPCMLVTNHSGGLMLPDMWGLGYAWVNHFGKDRLVHPLAHEMVFTTRTVGTALSRAGVMRAGRENTRRVLHEAKRDVLVAPGGDLDVFRPWKDRYKVTFGGRTGYARMALRLGVPIAPLANAGPHDTLMVLTQGRGISKRLHLKEYFRSEIFPISIAFPWGLAIGPLPHIPPPTHLRYLFGPAIQPESPTGPNGEPTDSQVIALDKQVRQAVQSLLDQLKATEKSYAEKLASLARMLRARGGDLRQLATQRFLARDPDDR
jgi:1-acyl-sn-glycerol-3-phosphate acyltransferase